MITVTKYALGFADVFTGRAVTLTLNEDTYVLDPAMALRLCDDLGDAGITAQEYGDDA